MWKIQAGGALVKMGPASQPAQTDGEAADAAFDNPIGIAGDQNGNIFVSSANRIRKIDSRLVVSTLSAPGAVLSPGVHLVTAHFTPTDRRNFLPTFASTWVVVSESTAPAIAIQPQDSTASAGEDVSFSALAATSGATTYQWQRWDRQAASWSNVSDGDRYGGAGTATLRLQRVTPLDDGDRFRLLVTDSRGTTATNSVLFSIRGGWIVNISTRAFVGGDDQAAIGGFVITGAEPKQILVRASGPALAAFGVGGAIPDPRLRLFRDTTQLATIPHGAARPIRPQSGRPRCKWEPSNGATAAGIRPSCFPCRRASILRRFRAAVARPASRCSRSMARKRPRPIRSSTSRAAPM